MLRTKGRKLILHRGNVFHLKDGNLKKKKNIDSRIIRNADNREFAVYEQVNEWIDYLSTSSDFSYIFYKFY